MKRHEKQRGTERRITFALRLLRGGFPLEEAARRAYISEERLQRALGTYYDKQLMEGEDMTEQDHKTTLGHQGLLYGTPAAEEMITERMRRLGEERHVAVGQLAASGDLKTLGEATTRSVSLAEASGAGREVSAEERQARDWLARAKEEAAERGVSLSVVMNEKAMRGEVLL